MKERAGRWPLPGGGMLMGVATDEELARLGVGRCHLPPPGWRCTRKPGHEGPCAAIPETRGSDLPGWPLVLLGVLGVLALGVAFVVFLASRAFG